MVGINQIFNGKYVKLLDNRDTVARSDWRFPSLGSKYEGQINRAQQRDYNKEFDRISSVSNAMIREMARGYGLGAGIVDVLSYYTSKTYPYIVDTTENATKVMEKAINDHLKNINFYQNFFEAHKMSLIDGHAYIIFEIADGKDPLEPVGDLQNLGGIKAIKNAYPVNKDYMQPVWADGEVKHYRYTQANAIVHLDPSRVLIMSKDQKLNHPSILHPVFHNIVYIDRMLGASTEGVWKNASAGYTITLANGEGQQNIPDQKFFDDLQMVIKAMHLGIAPAAAIQGADKVELMQTDVADITSQIEGNIKIVSAGTGISYRILIGSMVGQQAADQDAKAFLDKMESKRNNEVRPILIEMMNRFDAWGVFGSMGPQFELEWDPLNDQEVAENFTKVKEMVDANLKQMDKGLPPPFSAAEIRKTVGKRTNDETWQEIIMEIEKFKKYAYDAKKSGSAGVIGLKDNKNGEKNGA